MPGAWAAAQHGATMAWAAAQQAVQQAAQHGAAMAQQRGAAVAQQADGVASLKRLSTIHAVAKPLAAKDAKAVGGKPYVLAYRKTP